MIWITILACILIIIASGILSVNILINEDVYKSIFIYFVSLFTFYFLISI